MSNLTSADFKTSPILLLTIFFGGREYGFSTYPVTVVGNDGELRQFGGGLPTAALERSWSLSRDSPTRTAFSFESLYFPDDIAKRVAQDHDFSNATGEIALWQPGTTWEGRRVWIVGDVVNPIYGSAGQPVSLTIERQPYNDRGRTHDTEARVTEITWPGPGGAPAESLERWYPIPIGYPGRIDDGTITRGSPGIVVGQSLGNVTYILISIEPVQATHVYVFDESGSQRMAVSTVKDGNDRSVAVVLMTGYGRDRTLSEYWIGFSRDDGGGILNKTQSAAIEGLGEVIRWGLEQCTVPISHGDWARVQVDLDSMMKVAGYLDEPANPWDWIKEYFLPLAPIDVQSGPHGLYPVLWRQSREEDAVKHLVAGSGNGVERTSRVEYTRTKDKLVNGYVVRYAIRADTDDPYQTLSITPKTTGRQSSSKYRSGAADRSANRYGIIAITEIESRWLWTEYGAANWASWKLQDSSIIPRKVSYRAPIGDGWLLRAGYVVTITDSELYFNRQVATVKTAVLEANSILLTLDIRSALGRDRSLR